MIEKEFGFSNKEDAENFGHDTEIRFSWLKLVFLEAVEIDGLYFCKYAKPVAQNTLVWPGKSVDLT